MDVAGKNQRVASALYRAGVLDQATLRQALEQSGGEDLGPFLIRAGRLRPEDLRRALAAPASSASGRVPAVGTGPAARPTAGYAAAQAAGGDPATDLTVRLGAGDGEPAPTGAESGSGSFLSAAMGVQPGEAVPPGSTLGPYVVKRLLAKGGMGAVFVAEHASLGRTVALKVLLAGDGATDEQLARFLVEARTSSKLNHPNVVPVYEVGEAHGVRYLTMELVGGPSLKQLVRDGGPLPPRRAMHLVEQVARGVAAAHAVKVVHRDLKPHNVLVAPGDVAKVMDFGLAKESDHAGQGLTVSGALLGTPSYMAPEQAAGERVGPPADVYGVGAILYECLTGKPPFEGSTLANIITKVLTQDLVSPRHVRPAIHVDVETICLKALEKDPARRYPSAAALADDVARWLAGEGISARPASRGERLARWTRKRRAWLIPSALGAAALVGSITFFAGVKPALDGRRADAAAQAAEAAAVAAAAAFEAEVVREAAAVAALASEVTADAGTVEGFDARLAAREQALRDRRAGLPDEVRARVQARPSFLPVDELAAAARAVHAAAVEDPVERARALAHAFAAAPRSRVGLGALVEVVEQRFDPQADVAVASLLDGRALPDALRARVLLARARRLLQDMDLSQAAHALEDAVEAAPGSAAAAEAGRLLAGLVEPWRRVTDLPGAARWVTVEPGAVTTIDVRGGLRWTWDPGAGALVERTLPPLREGVLPPGDSTCAGAACVLPSGVPVIAFTTNRKHLLIVQRGEEAPQVFPRVSRAMRPEYLRFVELDGDPATAELVALIGPNHGDSAFVRVGAAGPMTLTELDPAGRARGQVSYQRAYACGPLGPAGEPRLFLGYGVFAGYDLRVFGLDDVLERRAPRASSGPIGEVTGVALHDVDGDGRPEVVTSHAIGARREGERFAGVQVHAYDEREAPERRFRRRGALEVEPPELDQDDNGVQGLTVARVGGRSLALLRVQHGQVGGKRFGRWLVVDDLAAERPAPLLDLPHDQRFEVTPVQVLGSADLDGDGDDELVVHRDRRLQVLGLAAGREPPRRPPVRVTAADPEQEAIELLRRLGHPEAALALNRRREAAQGVTREGEATALELLAEQQVSPDEHEAFCAQLEAFVAAPERSAAAAARGQLLLARRRFDHGEVALAWDALREVEGVHLGPADATLSRRLERVLVLRGALGEDRGWLVLDLRSPPTLRSSDLHRVAVDPRRGLVAHANRRVRLWAGVPLVLPSGAIRLTLDFTTSGRTWQGRCEVGLVRDKGVGGRVEGLMVGLSLWASGDLRVVRQLVTPGIGAPTTYLSSFEPDPGHILDPLTEAQASECSVGLPYLHGGRYTAVLEHDPGTRWTRYELRDRDRGGRLVVPVVEGFARTPVPTGRLYAGIFCPGIDGRDLSGENFAADATVVLERVEVRVVGPGGAKREARVGEDVVEGRAAGTALLGEPAAARRLFDEALARPSRDGLLAALVLQRAALLAPDEPDVVIDDVRRLLRLDPLGLLEAVEASGWRFDAALAEAVARALALELREPPGEGPWPHLRRAVAHRLRGELAPAWAAVNAARPLAAEPRARLAVAYVGASCGFQEDAQEVTRLRPDAPLPERDWHLRRLWYPVDAPASGEDLDAWFRQRAAEATDPDARLAWLRRWIGLRPDAVDARRARASLLAAGPHAGHLRWLIRADLQAWVEARPADDEARLALAQYDILALDYPAAGATLRPLLARPAGRARIEQLLARFDPDLDVDWAGFRRSVLADDATWAAFLDGLPREDPTPKNPDR